MFTAFVIVICCLILASAQPLSVAASESEDSGILDKTSVAVVSLLASGAASYIASVELGVTAAGVAAMGGAALGPFVCGCIVVVLVGLGTALLVSGIAAAINKAYELGYFQEFVDKIAEGLNGGWISGIKNKVVFGAAMLSYAYTWVKEHIVGYFNERVEVPVPDGNLKGFNNTNANVEIGSYTFDGSEFVSNQGERTVYSSDNYVYTNTVTNNKFYINVDLVFNSLRNSCSLWLIYKVRDLNNNISISWRTNMPYSDKSYSNLYSQAGSGTIKFYMPYVTNEEVKLNNLLISNTGQYLYDNVLSIYNLQTKIENNIIYYIGSLGNSNSNNERRVHASTNTYTNTNGYLEMTYDDTVHNFFKSIDQVLFFAITDNCSMQLTYENYSYKIANTQSDTSYNSYNTVNDYYNATSDILNTVSETIRGKVSSGDITNQSEGSISIGVSDVYSGALTDGVVDSLAITNLASITELNATDIVTNNVVVLEADTITSLPVALKVAADNIRVGTVDLKYKFPFDVIYSVATWLQALVTEGEPLVIDYDFTVPLLSDPVHVHIDFSRYQSLVTVGNWVVLVSVAIGCLLASKKAIEAI